MPSFIDLTSKTPLFLNQSSPQIMAANPFDRFAVQNVIAKYAVALDTKQFDLLNAVFTEDVDTIYPFKGEIKGVKEVAAAIKKRSVLPTTITFDSTLLTRSQANSGNEPTCPNDTINRLHCRRQ